ncbi:hypothetical protein QFZ43_008624 [Streptomyces afghaniensis]|nr:hypothetical protein [Streptomyces afghaniensis]
MPFPAPETNVRRRRGQPGPPRPEVRATLRHVRSCWPGPGASTRTPRFPSGRAAERTSRRGRRESDFGARIDDFGPTGSAAVGGRGRRTFLRRSGGRHTLEAHARPGRSRPVHWAHERSFPANSGAEDGICGEIRNRRWPVRFTAGAWGRRPPGAEATGDAVRQLLWRGTLCPAESRSSAARPGGSRPEASLCTSRAEGGADLVDGEGAPAGLHRAAEHLGCTGVAAIGRSRGGRPGRLRRKRRRSPFGLP